jgi:hypothetical protein
MYNLEDLLEELNILTVFFQHQKSKVKFKFVSVPLKDYDVYYPVSYVSNFVRDYGSAETDSDTACALACTDREKRGNG